MLSLAIQDLRDGLAMYLQQPKAVLDASISHIWKQYHPHRFDEISSSPVVVVHVPAPVLWIDIHPTATHV